MLKLIYQGSMSIYRTKFEGELGGSWDNIVCYVCGGGGGGGGREGGPGGT